MLTPGVWVGFLVASLMALLTPFAWWGSGAAIDHLFFHEILTYRKARISNHGYDLETMGHLLMLECVQIIETQAVCLFIFNEATGSYRLRPTLGPETKATVHIQALLHRLSAALFIAERANGWYLTVPETVLAQLETAKRPLYLREVEDHTGETTQPRFLVAPQIQMTRSDDPLLIPLRFQKRVIGLLALGPRGNRQPYAGPDFERLQAIVDRYNPILEEVRERHEAQQSAMLFFHIYRFAMEPLQAAASVDETAKAYMIAGAEATRGRVSCWLVRGDDELVLFSQHGSGPHLPNAETLVTQDERDWQPFYTAIEADHDPIRTISPSAPPPCLGEAPLLCSYAWLPLISESGQRIGVLMFTTPEFHRFGAKERYVLEVFAAHCAQTLHNLQVTAALQAAYEQQLAVDRLKDAFLLVAAQDLSLPLTAVIGYIELLEDEAMSHRISPTRQAELGEKAVGACNELIQSVQNLMEYLTPQAHASATPMTLPTVALASVCCHTREILDALFTQRQQIIDLDIAPALVVMADETRLRQALLTLFHVISNAAPCNSHLHVTACEHEIEHAITIQLSWASEILFGKEEGTRSSQLSDLEQRTQEDGRPRLQQTGLEVAVSRQWIEAMGGQLFLEDVAERPRLVLSLPGGRPVAPSSSSAVSFNSPGQASEQGTNQ